MILLAIAALILIGFGYHHQQTLAYDVLLDGEVIGQVKDPGEAKDLLQNYVEQTEKKLGQEVELTSSLDFEPNRLKPAALAGNLEKILRQKVELLTEAYVLYIDGEKYLAVLKKDDITGILEEYKSRYLTGIDETDAVEEAGFKQQVEVKKEQVSVDTLVTPEEAREKINAPLKEAQVVKVQKGDNLWLLARRYGTTVDELTRLNPDIKPERLYPGDELVISPEKPLLDVVVNLEKTVREKIPFPTEYRKDSTMFRRERRVIRPGREGEKEVTYRIALVNGVEQNREVVAEKVIREPVSQIVKVGTKTTVSRGGRRNYGVVQGKRVSSGFGWRRNPITGRRQFHAGVDIAASYGNGVYAYAEGKVVYAGWAGGYGKVIFIDHGNGLETRYAHLSRIYVKVGEKVRAGQRIGAVGSTGRSTGPHLHFEVRVNGRPQSPWKYL
ncbi:peptidase M23 [Calderihabitans maritimus]|uniref:Peptidase M23 n=1 Tax=Calderihabitans maritimus TaxID=1246530 RepID=A0A1Z5HU93_9FIRM|nr:peptidase M23 [Calderihabitans maritimus]